MPIGCAPLPVIAVTVKIIIPPFLGADGKILMEHCEFLAGHGCGRGCGRYDYLARYGNVIEIAPVRSAVNGSILDIFP